MKHAITPKYVQSSGLWNHFTGNKKWTVTCGECDYTWKEKLPIVENITVICPHCSTVNEWSASAFQRLYEQNLRN